MSRKTKRIKDKTKRIRKKDKTKNKRKYHKRKYHKRKQKSKHLKAGLNCCGSRPSRNKGGPSRNKGGPSKTNPVTQGSEVVHAFPVPQGSKVVQGIVEGGEDRAVSQVKNRFINEITEDLIQKAQDVKNMNRNFRGNLKIYLNNPDLKSKLVNRLLLARQSGNAWQSEKVVNEMMIEMNDTFSQ